MKYRIAISLVCGLTLAGCVEPPYRYQIHDTGEGTIQVETVPKTPVPAAAQPPALPPAPASVQSETDQQQIDQLQAQVRALSEENQKLKQAAPTSAPAKD